MALQTIQASDNGSTFIDKLNYNFAECASGSGDGSISVKAPLQGGELKASTGYADGHWCQPVTLTIGQNVPTFTYTDDDYNKYLHTPCYLSLAGNKVKSVTVPSGSTLTIFCYDETFTLMSDGVVNSVPNIPAGAAYVKFQLYNSSGFSQVFALGLVLAAQPKWVKNSFSPLMPQFHNFECKPPKLWGTNYTVIHTLPTDTTVDADNTRYHDNAFVMLPPNYSPDGEPCKFVIFFSGDACIWFMAHNPFIGNTSGKVSASVYEQNFKYLNNMGYAVVSLGGYTSMWGSEYGTTRSGHWTSRISPAYMASVRGLYDFLMANYNFNPSPYIAAKSAGGAMLLNTAATLPFPVRAAAGFSISVSMADIMSQCMLSAQKSWQKRLGCSNWDSFVLNNRDYATIADGDRATKKSGATADQIADADRLIANKDIYRNFDQFTAMSDMDYGEFLNAVLLYDPFNDAEPPQSLTTLLENSHKNMRVPVKLWCATADRAVPYPWHKLYVDWVNRCNGNAVLRSYTGNDGDHGTFCGGTTHVVNNIATPYGGTMSGVNIGIVEAVEWFKRW